MKLLFDSANQYVQKSDWRDLAVLKFCLLSLGLLAGMEVPERGRKGVRFAAALLFTVTYIPLMVKFLLILMENGKAKKA